MKYENNALLLGRVLGIPIRLHLSLLILVGVFALVSGTGFLAVLVLAVGLFGSVALHELGHSVVAQAKGCRIHEIVLYPFGGAAKIANLPKRPLDEIQIALAGPAVSLLLAVLFSLLPLPFAKFVAYINVMLFFFNLLPAFPMDGGRVFRSMLAIRKGRLEATRIAAKVGKWFCVLFIVVGLIRFDFILALIGFYILRAGQAEYAMVALEYAQTNPFGSGTFAEEEQNGVEVGPPPYAEDDPLGRFRNLFRR